MKMPPWRRIGLPALALVAAVPAGGAAQDVDAPAETVGTHTVRRGDTLWDLAARYLNSPYRWPSIFEINTDVVEDPHWIYPGERLRIPGAIRRVDRVITERAEDVLRNVDDGEVGRFPATSIFRQPRGGLSSLSSLTVDQRPPIAAVTLDDFRRASTLEAADGLGPEGTTLRLLEENPLGLEMTPNARQHGQVILALGSLDAGVGDTLRAVRHVRRHRTYGDVVTPMALLEVAHTWADSARATVVKLYGDYQAGDPVVALDRFELDPRTGTVDVANGPTGRIIEFEVPQVLLGIGDLVFLDLGESDGIRIGDEFGSFSPDESGAIRPVAVDALAWFRVVRVTERTSTARVVHIRDAGTLPDHPVRQIRRVADAETSPDD